MADYGTLFESPDGTRGEIMTATYEALCRHGYADLSIQDIADGFGKSKSLLYHHYDSKDDLMLDFLEFMLEGFEEEFAGTDGGATAEERLGDVLDYMLAESVSEERLEFTRSMAELRARAATDPRYRDRIARHDAFLVETHAEVVQQGIEEGVFRDVEPYSVASFVFTVMVGTMEQRVTSGNPRAPEVREQVDGYLSAVLLKDG
jgi:AcrR family transcriptional regulator